MWSGGIAPLFLILALDGSEWSASRSCRFIPREIDPGTHSRGDWVGPQNPSGRLEGRKTFPLPGLELGPSPVQPVVSRYTDCTVPTVRWEDNIEICLKEVG